MGLTAMIQTSYLLLIGLQKAALDKGRDGLKAMALVQEFVSSDFRDRRQETGVRSQ